MLLRLVLWQRLCVTVSGFLMMSHYQACIPELWIMSLLGMHPMCSSSMLLLQALSIQLRAQRIAAAHGFLLVLMRSFSTYQLDHSDPEVAFKLIHACTIQDEFLELMLPMVSATIRGADERGEGQADPAVALDPSVAKALRRRQRGVSRKKVFAEADTVFKVTLVLGFQLATCVYCCKKHVPRISSSMAYHMLVIANDCIGGESVLSLCLCMFSCSHLPRTAYSYLHVSNVIWI